MLSAVWGSGPLGTTSPDPVRAASFASYVYTGARQAFQVPAGVRCLAVSAYGAQGGQGANRDAPGSVGGKGGHTVTTLAVTPGEILGIYVGGQGNGQRGGWNGGGDGGDATEDDGGGGGGASDIRRSLEFLEDRLVVAGGGGGGGGDADHRVAPEFDGGAGGGVTGGAGHDSRSDPPTPGGEGGTQFAGGAAPTYADITAERGSLGQGGKGGLGPSVDDAGGGGGGGYYGGGGGAGEDDDVGSDGGGGGGGGSGFPASAFFETGVRSGNGFVELQYEPGAECADFDWTMPDRFGFDKNGDGLVDYYPPTGSLVIEPTGWRVDFKHNKPITCDPSLRRTWFINGHEVLFSDPNVVTFSPLSCEFSYKFPKEDIYHVKLVVKDLGDVEVASAEHDVTVQDWLIVSIGDSVGSGEGVPDLSRGQTGGDARWQSERCHRSAYAGPALAAKKIEDADKRTSVTFVHLACSGAEITSGLINGYDGIDPSANEPRPISQIEQIKQLIPNREIDAITMSIGANDVGFSSVVTQCYVMATCDQKPSVSGVFAIKLGNLPNRFNDLWVKMRGSSGIPGVSMRRVYVTEYHDPTRADDATVCGDQGTKTVLYDGPASLLFSITAAEATWATTTMVTGLIQTVQSAALNLGWSYIGQIRPLFLFHGYCANDSWVVRYAESQANQDDKNGTLHPNLNGYLVYANRIEERLTSELYANSDLTQPRPPQP